MNYNWASVKDRLPGDAEWDRSRGWEFLCDVAIPEKGGGYRRAYKVLSYDKFTRVWGCKDMIVLSWCEIEAPKGEF